MTELIITSSVLILVIILLRHFLKGKFSLRLQYALWALVLIRLLIPASPLESPVSVMNTLATKVDLYENITDENAPALVSAAPPALGDTLNVPETDTVINTGPGVITDVHQETVDWSVLLRVIWYTGIGVVGLSLLLSNLSFSRKLRKTRKKFEADGCRLPVYEVEALPSPCLFGLFQPAIYITPDVAGDEARLRHVLAHELTHYRHGDHLWSALRSVCLTLHWYNPLVWLGAVLSRRDAELACDEAAIKSLGEASRLEYGRVLIGLTCEKRGALDMLCCATTMTDGIKGIRERIALIAKKPKMLLPSFVAVLLVVAVTVGCTFTGAQRVEAEIIPLTAEEIEQYNKEFEQVLFDDEGNPRINPLSHFFSSYYDRPEDINLSEFIRYFPSEDVTEEAEFEALKATENWPFGPDVTLDGMPVPIHRIPVVTVNEALKKHMGITLKDLSGVGLTGMKYLKEYDAYYTFTSDAGAGFFVGTYGERQGDLVRLYSSHAMLTLKLQGDGFLIVSHQKADEERTTIFSSGYISISVAAQYADRIYVDSLYSDNIFTVIANLYFEPDYTESDVYTAQMCGGWIMSVTSVSGGMPGLESGIASEYRYRAIDQEKIYIEEYPMQGHYHYKDHPENTTIYQAILDSLQVDYGNLEPYAAQTEHELQVDVGEAPDAVIQYAQDYIRENLQYYTDDVGYTFTDASITGLTRMETGTTGLATDIQLWRLEYRLRPDQPENVALVGGMTMEEIDGESWLTEWGSTGQPYLLLVHDSKTDTWQRICVTNTDVINQDFGTPELLEKYGNAFAAAAIELYRQYAEVHTIGQISQEYTLEQEPGHTAVRTISEHLMTELLDDLKTERDGRTFTITDWKNLTIDADRMYDNWLVMGEVEVRYEGVLSPVGNSEIVPEGEYVKVSLGERQLRYDSGVYTLSLPSAEHQQAVLEPPQLTPDMTVGIGVLPDYADDDLLIFHGYFGLFVYDLNTEKIIFSSDLQKAVGTTIVQGSEGAAVRVSPDGGTILLYFFPEQGDPKMAYTIDPRSGSYTYGDYEPMDAHARITDELYSSFSFGTIGELTYTDGEKSWLLFADWDWAK